MSEKGTDFEVTDDELLKAAEELGIDLSDSVEQAEAAYPDAVYASEQGSDPTFDPNQVAGQIEVEPRFEVGLTPLGRPAVNITDSNGLKAGYVFSQPDELSAAVGHLNALLTMMIQSLYQEKLQEQQIAAEYAALTQKNPGGVWTP